MRIIAVFTLLALLASFPLPAFAAGVTGLEQQVKSSKIGQEQKCDPATPCPPGKVCVDGVCVDDPKVCGPDKPCPPGKVCVDGVCKDDPNACSPEKPCPPGKVCVDGVCKDDPNACSPEKPCPPGKVCVDGVCKDDPNACSPDKPCPPGKTCVGGVCKDDSNAGGFFKKIGDFFKRLFAPIVDFFKNIFKRDGNPGDTGCTGPDCPKPPAPPTDCVGPDCPPPADNAAPPAPPADTPAPPAAPPQGTGSGNGKVNTLTSANFANEVLAQKGVTVVTLSATWCGPCRQFAPTLDRLAKNMGDVKFGKADVDRSRDLYTRYGGGGVPTIVIFKDGKPVKTLTGNQNYDSFKKLVETYQK